MAVNFVRLRSASQSFGLAAVLVALTAQASLADFMYVTNGGQGPSFVAKYTTSGTYVGQFTNDLNNPAGIAQDLDGNYYVVNNGGNNYRKFTPDGTLLATVSTNLSAPQGITVDKFGNVYVSEGSGTVEKFNSAGTWQMQFASSGAGYSISNAQGLGIDASGVLYIADSSANNQVVMLNSVTGGYVNKITTNLSLPHGVIRDAAGFLYVSNANVNTVSKFNPDYSFNSTIAGSMSFPIGIGLDASGNLFVANNSNNTITKYDSSGALTQTISGNLAGARWLAFKPYAVPEPSTYAMALAGLACGGFSMWRRRKAALT